MSITFPMWIFSGSASVAFLTLSGMESLLSHQYFQTENITEMYSGVITALLPSVNNTNLTEPVNFTLQHKKVPPNSFRWHVVCCVLTYLIIFISLSFHHHHHQTVTDSGMVTCVYWEDNTETDGSGTDGQKNMGWSVKGCWVSYTNENYTVCTCSHLSTFALILQIAEVYTADVFLNVHLQIQASHPKSGWSQYVFACVLCIFSLNQTTIS